MNQRPTRGDIRRCMTAAGRPAIALTALVWIALSLAAARVRPTTSIPISGIQVAATAAIVLASVWFVAATTRAVTSPRRDSQAADRLNCLRERATQPGYSLWEIQGIEWASAAGQRAVGVDVTTGNAQLLWLEQCYFVPGTFVLVMIESAQHHLIDSLDPKEVALAVRHSRRERARALARSAQMSQAVARRQRNEADRVVREAEELLR